MLDTSYPMAGWKLNCGWNATGVGLPMLAWTSDRGVSVYRREIHVSTRSGPLLPQTCLLSVMVPWRCTDAPIGFTHVSGVDRFTEAIGITGRVKTGDPAFDDAIAIDTDASFETVHALLERPSARAHLAGLLAMSGELRIEDTTITIRVSTWQVADPWRALGLFEALVAFAATLPDGNASPYRQAAPERPHAIVVPRRWLPRVASVLAIVLGALAVALVMLDAYPPPMASHDLAVMGRRIGAGLWLVCCVLAFLALRGRFRSVREIALAWLVLVPLVPGGGAAAELSNAWLPQQGPMVRRAGFLDCRGSKRNGKELTVTTPHGEVVVYERMVGYVPLGAHRPVVIDSQVGALGVEHITRVRYPAS